MKTYTIEIHAYPQEFIITADSKEKAIEKARERWNEYSNGKSIYESKVIDITGEISE